MSTIRTFIATNGVGALTVTHTRSVDDEAIHLTHHRVEIVDPADASNVLGSAHGVAIEEADDDGDGAEYEGRWVSWEHQAHIHDGELAWVASQMRSHCAGVDGFIDAGTLSYLERVEIAEDCRGLGLGQWLAAKFIETVAAEDATIFGVVAGWPDDTAASHAPAEVDAVNRLVAGLPLEMIGDQGDRLYVGCPRPGEIVAALAAAAERTAAAAA